MLGSGGFSLVVREEIHSLQRNKYNVSTHVKM